MAGKPRHHLGMFVGGVIVENDTDGFAGGNFGVDGVQNVDKLLMAMVLHAAANHLAFENVERRRAVACHFPHCVQPKRVMIVMCYRVKWQVVA